MNTPLVSVIIPTKNEEENIKRCLVSVINQSYKNIEIIVVDNNSVDKTREMAKRYTQKVLNKGPERNIQRNFGVKKAKGQYLLFLDADMELERNVVLDCVRLAEQGPCAMIIPEKSIGQGFWAKCRALEKSFYIGDDLIEAARFFEKKAFEEIGGFDTNLIASEDWDLTWRARKKGFRIERIKSFILHHEGKLSLHDAMGKKYYYGLSLPKYISKHPKLARKQYRLFRPAFLKNWKRLISDPFCMLGLFFMKFCEFFAGGIGIIKSKLMKK